jgi:hypothetical protein
MRRLRMLLAMSRSRCLRVTCFLMLLRPRRFRVALFYARRFCAMCLRRATFFSAWRLCAMRLCCSPFFSARRLGTMRLCGSTFISTSRLCTMRLGHSTFCGALLFHSLLRLSRSQ